MKQVLIAALGLTACGVGIANANLLSNPNLDTISVGPQSLATPTGWSVNASKSTSGTNSDGCSSETFCNVCCASGNGLFFKPFGGTPTDRASVLFFQNNPATPGGKYTLSGYFGAEANYCGFFATNSPAPQTLMVVEFLDGANNVLSSNAFDLIANGLTAVGAGGGQMVQLTTTQYTATAGSVTVRAGTSMLNAYGTSGAQAFVADVFDLEVVVPPGAPVITNQPSNVTVGPGGTATFSVGVSNPPVTYQWQLNQTNISNGGHFSGVNTATLTVTPASFADVGRYRVQVSNGGGTVSSSEATLTIVANDPAVVIYGKTNDTYRVDFTTAVAPATWTPLSTNKLTNTQQLVIDPNSPQPKTRYYRSVFLF